MPTADLSRPTTSEPDLQNAILTYYEHYYRTTLGLPDWRQRAERRLDEENLLGKGNLERIESWLGYDFEGQRVLVVGAGTGAETFALFRKKADVYAIEPDDDALEILWQKAKHYGIDQSRFISAVAEQIPHDDKSFDFVYCYTVLEHVADVKQTIAELIRVCKPDGYVFIGTPDYRFPYENHYKVTMFTFLPRWINRLYLKFLGRPTEFLNSLNFVTGSTLSVEFWKHNVDTIRISEPVLYKTRETGLPRLTDWYVRKLGIEKQQNIFLRKRSE